MTRRLFLARASTTLSSLLLPTALVAPHFVSGALASPEAPSQVDSELIALLQPHLIGELQWITLSHQYSHEYTSPEQLLATAQYDLERIGRWIGQTLALTPQTLVDDKLAASFGTYSARINQNKLILSWQGYPRTNHPSAVIQSQLIMAGSQGVLRLNGITQTYLLVNLQGKTLKSGNWVPTAPSSIFDTRSTT